jgi:hypothetical protein
LCKTIGKKCTPKIAEKVLSLFVPMPGNPERMINEKLEKVRKEQETGYLRNIQRLEKKVCVNVGKKGLPAITAL